MVFLMCMLACMAVRRRIAASNVAASETKPQMDPVATNLQTILAAVQCLRLNVADLGEMRAFC